MTPRLLTALAAVSIAASSALVSAPASTSRVSSTVGPPRSATAATTTAPPTFYVDAASGSDARPGASAATAWRSLAKVTAATLSPGARCCCGGVARSARASPGRVGTVRGADHSVRIRCGCRAGHHRWWCPGACVLLSGSMARPRQHHGGPVRLQQHRRQRRATTSSGTPASPAMPPASTSGPARTTAPTRGRVHRQRHRERQHPVAGSGRLGRVRLPHPRRPRPVSANTVRRVGRPVVRLGLGRRHVRIFDGDHNTVAGNLAVDDDDFSESGHSKKQSTVEGNVYPAHDPCHVRSCSEAHGPDGARRQHEVRPRATGRCSPTTGAADRRTAARLSPATPAVTAAILTMRNNAITVTSSSGACRLERRRVPPGGATCCTVGSAWAASGRRVLVGGEGGAVRIRVRWRRTAPAVVGHCQGGGCHRPVTGRGPTQGDARGATYQGPCRGGPRLPGAGPRAHHRQRALVPAQPHPPGHGPGLAGGRGERHRGHHGGRCRARRRASGRGWPPGPSRARTPAGRRWCGSR